MTRRRWTTLALLLVLVALLVVPLLLGGAFEGTDGQAGALVEASHPGYRPWYDSFFHPSGEVESGLFALQAAIGAGVLGYVIGWYRGRRSPR